MNVFSVFQHLQKDKQRKQCHSLKLGKKRRESSKRNYNYYIISPRVIIKAIIIRMAENEKCPELNLLLQWIKICLGNLNTQYMSKKVSRY